MVRRPTKYIFVTGGVLSGLGKGITAASIGTILKARGLRVNIQKLDPYLNVDAGTLNPAEHGECFVTKDGAETDLDLGHYERFLDVELTKSSSVMSGRVLQELINDEREGKFLGKTVQVVPHLTNAIQSYIDAASEGFDVHIIEIGGTVGDYESPSFFEAIREYASRVGPKNCINVQVVYLPYLAASKEVKTKPAQNATRELRSMGIVPDLLVARCETLPANDNVQSKLSAFCGVPEQAVALLPNADSVYEVPLTLEEQKIGSYIMERLGLRQRRANLKDWRSMVNFINNKNGRKVKIAIVAKYLDNEDTYISVIEALKSAAWHNKVELEYTWVDSESLEAKNASLTSKFKKFDGIIVPGGFGTRGIEGKIKTAQHSLKKKIPYLGLCLGLQVAVIAAARNGGLATATSAELDPAGDLVINTMVDQMGKEGTGGTMRLGNYPCKLQKGSKVAKLYGKKQVLERHRHRYECNNEYRDKYSKWGIQPVGVSPDQSLVEVIEGTDHPFFVASQFHPEFTSRPNKPHPLFNGFIASLVAKNK